jgi:hypothetical protein
VRDIVMYRRVTASYDNANAAGAIMIVPGYGSPQSMSEIALASAGTTMDNTAIMISTDAAARRVPRSFFVHTQLSADLVVGSMMDDRHTVLQRSGATCQ